MHKCTYVDKKEAVRRCGSGPRRAYYYEGGGKKKDVMRGIALT